VLVCRGRTREKQVNKLDREGENEKYKDKEEHRKEVENEELTAIASVHEYRISKKN
jgi:hypothetical protein